ncbi:hypothetical protein HanRHA438_Chr14g0659581 [Helianthus annuus]|nr:hypothetical protein HanRHA438_Chr14g0659581 [Helianthus annuus]
MTLERLTFVHSSGPDMLVRAVLNPNGHMSDPLTLKLYNLITSRILCPDLTSKTYDSIQDVISRCSAPTDSPSDVDGVDYRVTPMLCLHIFSLDQSLGFSLSSFRLPLSICWHSFDLQQHLQDRRLAILHKLYLKVNFFHTYIYQTYNSAPIHTLYQDKHRF